METRDVLELNDALFVLGLNKKLLLVSCMLELQFRVAFEGHHCTINDCSLASSGTLARGVLDGGLYRLFILFSWKLDEPSSLKEASAENVWKDVVETCSKPIVESMIDSKLVVDGSVIEYMNRVIGFS
jgi:hypothetical protein